MPASAIAEPFTLSRPGPPRQDAGRGRANDDGFRAALGTVAPPGTSPARILTATVQATHAVAAGGGTPATGAKTKSTPPAGPGPVPPTPGDPATTPAAPGAAGTVAAASLDGAAPGTTAPSPPAADLATSLAPDTTAVTPPLLHADPGAGAPSPVRHDSGTTASRRNANTDAAPQAKDQGGAISPILLPPPAPPSTAVPIPTAVLAGTQAVGAPGPTVATGMPAVPGTAPSPAASTGASAIAPDAAATGPVSTATPSAARAGQAADVSTPATLSAPPSFAAALQATAGTSMPRRSFAAPATPAPDPSGAATRPASTRPASSGPASTEPATTGPASVGPVATASASATSASAVSDPSAVAQARTTLPQPPGTGQPDAATPGPARHLASVSGPADTQDAAGQPSPVEAGTAQAPVAQAPVAQDPIQAAPLATAQAGPQAAPAAMPAPATPSAQAPAGPAATPAAQLVPAVLAMHTANGAQNMMLRLTPVELGTVQVQITRDHDGTTSVSVLVERPETLRLLLHDQAQLQHALSQAGLAQDRTLSLQQAPPGSFAGQDHRAPARDLGQDAGSGQGGGDGQAGRDGARQGFAQGQGARSGSARLAPGISSHASAWQTAGVDITA